MFIRVDGSYSREDFGRVLSWIFSAVPEDVARFASIELSFAAFDHDGRSTYVPHVEGRPPGLVVVPMVGDTIEGDSISTRWIYPGVPGWCSESDVGGGSGQE